MKTTAIPTLLGALAILAFAPGPARAATTTAFPVLSLGQSARAQAMGDAFTGAADDLSSLQYNPAGLALWNREGFSLNHTSYLSNGFFENGAGSFPLPSLGTLAFQAGYLNYGSFDQRDSSGNLTGAYTPLEYSMGGALGFQLADELLGGLRTQWVQQNIAGNMATGLMWDFGLLWVPRPFFRVGADLQNIGVETLGESLPEALRLGAANQFDFDRKGENRVLLDLDAVLPFQGNDGLRVGVEYANRKKYFVRAGYAYDFQDQGLGGLNGLNMGLGAFIDPVEMDYCFSFQGDLGNTQQISLVLYLGAGPGGDQKQASSKSGNSIPATTNNIPGLIPQGSLPPSNPVILKFQVKGGDNLSAADLVAQGEAKERAGLVLEALDLYSQATQKDPGYKPAWAHLGNLSFKQSLDAMRTYLILDPSNDRLREWLDKYK
jgi:hypothetical protein